jgi:two-component system phosphate regulon sensor histidine kinase PhoR
VKHVAQRHGAELRIESVVGKGSRFALLFPVTRLRQAAALSAVA